jgi:pyrrolysine biosynthesis protein PylC
MNIKLQHFCLGIVGGALQGLESAYLAREAGYHVQVIDRDADAPALNLAHEAHILDVQKEPERFKEIVSCVGAILPATEETRTLDFLHRCCQEVGVPFLHDPGAYAISSSKIRSNAFLADCDIPIPKKWPKCNFPLVVKPSGASGSHGVRVVTDQSALDGVLQKLKTSYEEIVIEAYLKGPSLSLEVIAQEGSGFGYLVTELAFDDRLDCKRVYAPSRLPSELNDSLVKIGLEIARQLGLNGLMDVEVITDLERRELAVLEIDARIPSQTQVAAYLGHLFWKSWEQPLTRRNWDNGYGANPCSLDVELLRCHVHGLKGQSEKSLTGHGLETVVIAFQVTGTLLQVFCR